MSLDLDLTYILVLILFLLPLLILNGLLFRPFLELFERRHEQLEGAVERAENMLLEAEKRAHAFQEKIKVATAKGIEARNAIRTEAALAMNARLEQERDAMSSKLTTALEELERERERGLRSAAAEAERIAELTATKLLGRSI